MATVARTSKEAVKLHKKLQVDIVALGSLAVRVANMMAVQIDPYSSSD